MKEVITIECDITGNNIDEDWIILSFTDTRAYWILRFYNTIVSSETLNHDETVGCCVDGSREASRGEMICCK